MNTINFDVALKKILLEGTLAWEYNPFRNYRLDEDMIFYNELFYSTLEFFKKFIDENIIKVKNISEKQNSLNIECLEVTYESGEFYTYRPENGQTNLNWNNIIPNFDKTKETPVFYQKGLLVDFITNEFDFDLNHPIQITPTYSYDDSVDLIINDGKSRPKIINSRFSAIGKNKYRIIDRNGNNDTNIYDKGTQFDIDTSLYKITSSIPTIIYKGLTYGGNLKIGNYHFYFKYCDLDGNETDFVAQSGLVSVFIGNNPNSIHSGFRDLNSNKRIKFILSNVDESYDYIIVYYSRTTGEEFLDRITEYYKIDLKYKISLDNTIIDISGFESTFSSTFEEINQRLQIYDSVKTQALTHNMLFLGNVTLNNEEHDYLSRLALYIIPQLGKDNIACDIDKFSETYKGNIKNTYYDSNFIYNYTGYWDDEIYRFGVVFIKNNNTLTPVYNIRGLHLENKVNVFNYNNIKLTNEYKIEELISYDETTFNIDQNFILSKDHIELENAKGVCYIPKLDNLTKVIGIQFICHPIIIKALKYAGIKGYFIVRQKRIPTTLCQAYTIGIESESHTPVIPIKDSSDETKVKYLYESFLNETEGNFTWWNDKGLSKTESGYALTNSFEKHKRFIYNAVPKAAICPDYDVNSPYLNLLFTGAEFTVNTFYSKEYLNEYDSRLFSVNKIEANSKESSIVKIIGVEDNVKLVGIENDLFSARAGEAEEAFRVEYIGTEVKRTPDKNRDKNMEDNEAKCGNNLIRGSYGPYLGLKGYDSVGDLITIKIPEYNINNMVDYFNIRYHDASEFYPISDRIIFNEEIKENELYDLKTHYRGDCYICKFTHRLNRNFLDPSAPTNDIIVDPYCFTHNYKYKDDVLNSENFDKINLGDVNAVNLGIWVSFILRSNINHSVRSLNGSIVDEVSLIGHERGFYPYHPISAKAAYKLPEAGTYNKGFEASVGEQVFAELPVLPFYKNNFSTRIAYSNIQITNAFKNAYRVFPANHYRDYPITYGEITKIIEYNGDLIVVLEHGVYKIPVNERALAGEGSGGSVYINTSNVLPETPLVISDKFGSLWIDSVIKTPTGVYGVDTVAKKIWKVDNNGMVLISDHKVQEFLNNNITLTERELTPIIGIRNVKTHYNEYKNDVMFTFYDDLHGIDEVAWNLCWNEPMNKWITFYSWVPSFSENIYNSYFSFDRETSRNISLLALNEKSELNDLIYLTKTLFDDSSEEIGELIYDLPLEVNQTKVTFKWEIVPDPYLNYNYFELKEKLYTKDENNNIIKDDDGNDKYELKELSEDYTTNPIVLCLKNDYDEYVFEKPNIVTFKNKKYYLNSDKEWYDNFEVGKEGNVINIKSESIKTDKVLILQLNNQRIKDWKDSFEGINIEDFTKHEFIKRKVYLLNIKVSSKVEYSGQSATFAEFTANKNSNASLTGGYIERIIAVAPKDHVEALSTDFWKHGQSGLIDIKEEILPTKWYGKLHPFEFEFIVRDLADTHKIFNNLILISNKAEPESFHYEVIGEVYEFAKDKKNMYIRQEATKELFQENGYDISFNSNYKNLYEYHRPLGNNRYDKSTIFPAYYKRYDKVNTIEDYYHLKDGGLNKDYAYLSGSEIAYYKNLNEFRVCTHSKGVNLADSNNLLRGNMQYKEDKWYIQIPSINYVLCNESQWTNDKIPIELELSNFVRADELDLSSLKKDSRDIIFWDENRIRHQEAKLKDKYIKIRIRYSGEDLAVISAIKTLYSISYA